MSDDERGVQTEPQANRVSGVVDSQDETFVAPDSLSELPPSQLSRLLSPRPSAWVWR